MQLELLVLLTRMLLLPFQNWLLMELLIYFIPFCVAYLYTSFVIFVLSFFNI